MLPLQEEELVTEHQQIKELQSQMLQQQKELCGQIQSQQAEIQQLQLQMKDEQLKIQKQPSDARERVGQQLQEEQQQNGVEAQQQLPPIELQEEDIEVCFSNDCVYIQPRLVTSGATVPPPTLP